MEEIKIALGQTYMNVIRFGHGAKILSIVSGVSLCGLEGNGEGIASAYSIFAEEYTVYLFDRKKLLSSGYSVRDMANDVWYCLTELGISRTDVYGVSQGGMIGQWLALDHPEIVNKLVICSSMCRPTSLSKEVVRIWKEAASEYNVVKLNRLFYKYVYSKSFLDSVKDIIPELEQLGTPEDCDHFQVLVDAIYTFDVYDLLPTLTCPVFVLGDKNDNVIGPEGSVELAERLGCEIYLYEYYSHAVYDEAPDIKERILAFLR